MSFLIICTVAGLAAVMTFFSGFGLGTLLLPAFALFFAIEKAVALTAIVHFLNGIFKLVLVRKHVSVAITLRFGLPAALGALAGDVGFLPTMSFLGRLRGDFLNLSALICGNRFGRGLVRPGGCRPELDPARSSQMIERLETALADTEQADLARERKELATSPDLERAELAGIYVARGLTQDLAGQVADQLMAKDALAAHAHEG